MNKTKKAEQAASDIWQSARVSGLAETEDAVASKAIIDISYGATRIVQHLLDVAHQLHQMRRQGDFDPAEQALLYRTAGMVRRVAHNMAQFSGQQDSRLLRVIEGGVA
jgi:hypothetical protein